MAWEAWFLLFPRSVTQLHCRARPERQHFPVNPDLNMCPVREPKAPRSWKNNWKYWPVTNSVTFSVLLQVLHMSYIKPFTLIYSILPKEAVTLNKTNGTSKTIHCLVIMHTFISLHLMLEMSVFIFSISHDLILEALLSKHS